MRNSASWFKLMKEAGQDWGHGDTMHGQMRERETKAIIEKVSKLKMKAASPSSLGVLPRWAGEIRQKILLLPPTSRISKLSMYEIANLSSAVQKIEDLMARYRASRMTEIIGDANKT